MIAKAEGKFLRISPVKVRQVIDLIRYKDVPQATALLNNFNKGACAYLKKILKQATANAKIKGFNPKQLYISELVCNEGPSWKRFKAAAFGRAAPIKKRTSHIKIELDIKTGSL